MKLTIPIAWALVLVPALASAAAAQIVAPETTAVRAPENAPTSAPESVPAPPAANAGVELGERLAKELKLTESQQRRITALTAAFQTSHRDALARLQRARNEVQQKVRSGGQLSSEELRAIEEKYGHPQRELIPAMQELREDILAELTSAQRAQMEELRKRVPLRPGQAPQRE